MWWGMAACGAAIMALGWTTNTPWAQRSAQRVAAILEDKQAVLLWKKDQRQMGANIERLHSFRSTSPTVRNVRDEARSCWAPLLPGVCFRVCLIGL